MGELGEALRKYQELKKFKNIKSVKVPKDRMLMLHNEESGVTPLKENQPIRIMLKGVVGKPKKEGYHIRVDYAKMHDKDEDDGAEEKDRPIVSPSA